MSNVNAHRSFVNNLNVLSNRGGVGATPNVGSHDPAFHVTGIPKLTPLSLNQQAPGVITPPQRQIVVGPIVKGKPVKTLVPQPGKFYPL